VRTIEDNLIMWSPVEDRSLVFTIPGLSLPLVSEDALAAALTDLVYARAFPPQDGQDRDPDLTLEVQHFLGLDVFEELHDLGLVECIWRAEAGDCSRWALTQDALAQLRLKAHTENVRWSDHICIPGPTISEPKWANQNKLRSNGVTQHRASRANPARRVFEFFLLPCDLAASTELQITGDH
jgi:hypothetical protein